MFHKLLGVKNDAYFMNCDIAYIFEKYQSLIGLRINHHLIIKNIVDSSIDRSLLLPNRAIKKQISLINKKAWMSKWGTEMSKDQESVLNYLCEVNAVDYPTPSNIISIFSKNIGNINDINKVSYNHIHVLLREEINKYKDIFKREINLEFLDL